MSDFTLGQHEARLDSIDERLDKIEPKIDDIHSYIGLLKAQADEKNDKISWRRETISATISGTLAAIIAWWVSVRF